MKNQIRKIKLNKNNQTLLENSEYRGFFEAIMREFYCIGSLSNERICIQLGKSDKDSSIEIAVSKTHESLKNTEESKLNQPRKFIDIASRYAQNESKKSNSKNGGYSQRVAKALDIYFNRK